MSTQHPFMCLGDAQRSLQRTLAACATFVSCVPCDVSLNLVKDMESQLVLEAFYHHGHLNVTFCSRPALSLGPPLWLSFYPSILAGSSCSSRGHKNTALAPKAVRTVYSSSNMSNPGAGKSTRVSPNEMFHWGSGSAVFVVVE